MNRLTLFALFALTLLAVSIGFAQLPPDEFEADYSAFDQAIELRWHHPDGPLPTFYNVYRRAEAESLFTVISTPTDRRYDDESITLGTTYFYYLTAVYGSVESAPTLTRWVVAGSDSSGGGGGGPIEPPVNLTGHYDDDGKVELDWFSPAPPSSPLSYNIYRKGDSLSEFSVIGNAPEPEFDDFNVTFGATYNYFVTALYSGNVESGPSNTISVFISDSSEDSGEVEFDVTSVPPRTTLINQPYQYDVEVAGAPVGSTVCFTLKHAPTGMTIDAATGLIQWTPTRLGVFEIEVKARTCAGPEGEAEQEFHLLVLSGTPGSIFGTVTDQNALGLDSIKIKAFDVTNGAYVMKVYTDSSGNYSFPTLNPSTYFLKADAEDCGYRDEWFENASNIAGATPILVTEGASITINFSLVHKDSTGTNTPNQISGTVLDESALPVAGATVTLFSADDDSSSDDEFDDDSNEHEVVASTTTDSNGLYSFTMPEGHYVVGASADGFAPQYWNHVSSPLEAEDIHLEDNDITGIDFTLGTTAVTAGSISGTIRNGFDSTGVFSFVIAFHNDDFDTLAGDDLFSGYSDSLGNYTLSNIPDGDYSVLAVPVGNFIPTFYNLAGGTAFGDSATFVTVLGAAVAGVDIYALQDSVDGLNMIAGQVNAGAFGKTNSTLSAISVGGVLVTISEVQTGKIVSNGITNNSGSYNTTGIAPGTYNVTFQKPGLNSVQLQTQVSYQNNVPTISTVNALMSDGTGNALGIMSIQRGWNLVSLPVTVVDAQRTAVFPDANSAAFHFTSVAGYQSTESLVNGTGYWVKFPLTAIMQVGGTERANEIVSLNAGWNLIGSVSHPVETSSLVTSPEGILSANIWEYQRGYQMSQYIQPGKGYWVYASANGTVTMNGVSATPKSFGAISSSFAKNNSLTFRDADGNSGTLYFGSSLNNADATMTQMPPVPPTDAFDVRFASNRFAEVHSSKLSTMKEFAITLNALKAPVSIEWNINEAGFTYSLKNENGKPVATSNGNKKLVLNNVSGGTTRLVLGVQGQTTPQEFSLHQNYPNPFNPTTNFGFRIANFGLVTLKVYNLLGQEITTLMNNVGMEAGEYSVPFDASYLTSGIYFYRVTVQETSGQEFSAMKKMTLIR
ncbi:MAG: carboxypeptidase regulatory-like domain-containing protein [Ignavibacteriae bacterium]|nr:carboxypeptidase regulatory-like domain-containing protein [Ignavibacteriota bacterium]